MSDLSEIRVQIQEADDQLREYAAERAHGITANPEYLDRCAAAARFHTSNALALLHDVVPESA